MYIYVPNAPSVSASAITWYRIDLTITAPAFNGGRPITSYNIYINGSFSASTSYAGSITVYQATGLTAASSYTFIVTAVNSIGEGYQSTPVTISTPATIPNAPNGISFMTPSTLSQVTFTITNTAYNGGAAISSYKFYNITNGVNTTRSVASSYPISSLTANTLYSFQVAAINSAGESATRTAISATTLANAPSITGSSLDTSTITITITPVVNGGASVVNYYLYRNYSYLTSSAFAIYNDYSLTANTNYIYSVSTVNAGGESTQSSQLTVVTKPPAPTINSITGVTDTGMTVNFSPGAGGAVPVTYTIYVDNGVNGTTSSTSYSISGLSSGVTYSINVTASNASGESAYSNTVNQATLAIPPGAPSFTSVVNSDAYIYLTITAGSSGSAPITSYNIYQNGSYIGNTTTTTGTVPYTSFSSGTAYVITVRAVNSAGESPDSASNYIILYTIPGSNPVPDSGATPANYSTSTTVPYGYSRMAVTMVGGGQGGRRQSGGTGVPPWARGSNIYTEPNIIISGGSTVSMLIGAGGMFGSGTSVWWGESPWYPIGTTYCYPQMYGALGWDSTFTYGGYTRTTNNTSGTVGQLWIYGAGGNAGTAKTTVGRTYGYNGAVFLVYS